MSAPDRFASLFSLASEHTGDAAAGEVFLALEGIEPHAVAECWYESFGHSDRDAAAAVEHACASRWADWDLPGMAKAVLCERRSCRPVAKMAACLLGRLPHREAWAHLAALPGETEDFRFDYLAALAPTDPQQALALLPPLKRGYHGGGGRDSVIRAAASVVSPGYALDWLKKTRACGSDAHAAAGAVAKVDPPATLHIARWLVAEGLDHDADNTAAMVFQEWSVMDPQAAGRSLIEWLGGDPTRTPVTSWYTGRHFESVTGHVFRAWAAAAPEDSMTAARALPQDHMRRIALNSVGLGWPVPEEGLLAARELPPADRLAFLELASKSLAQSRPEMLRKELGNLPLPGNTGEAAILRDCWKQLSEEDAREFEQKAPELYEKEPMDIGSIVSGAFSSLHSPEALGKSLAQVRSILGQCAKVDMLSHAWVLVA